MISLLGFCVQCCTLYVFLKLLLNDVYVFIEYNNITL